VLPHPTAKSRGRRLRSPLLLLLWALLACEAAGGLVIFVARLVAGRVPGEALHLAAGVALLVVYALYQWRHWRRVRPLRPQLHHALGLIAALFMALTNLTGLWLAASWWRDRVATPIGATVRYPPLLSAVHNVASMVVLTFVGAHVGAVLFRDRDRPR
jgi:hypothetical protein